MTDQEEFFAWLDGELDSETAARVEARVAADPDLAEQARAHRALALQMRGAFDPVMAAPVPDRIGAPPDNFAAARDRRAARPVSRTTQWGAMAATLALGIGLGNVVGGGGQTSPVAVEDGRLVAAADLAQALDTQLASAPAGAGARIGLTFRDKAGSVCRSFTDGGASGLACRADGDWKIRGLFQQGTGEQGEYRMAAGNDPRLASLIEESIAGEPLDATAERKAQELGWR